MPTLSIEKNFAHKLDKIVKKPARKISELFQIRTKQKGQKVVLNKTKKVLKHKELKLEKAKEKIQQSLKNQKKTTATITKHEKEIKNLSSLPEESPHPVLRISKDGIILYANKASKTLLNEWKCSINTFLPKKLRKLTLDLYTTNQKKEIHVDFKNRFLKLTISPVKKFGYINFFARDITTEKKTAIMLAKRGNELSRMRNQSEKQLAELDHVAKNLVRRDLILSQTRNELEAKIIELDKTAKQLIRRDLELTLANERLSELDKIKSEFISVVAHQLRTPLSAIKWILKMFIDGDIGDLTTEQLTFMMKSYESNERMISLINDLLNVDRIETGRIKYKFNPIQLEDLIDNVLFEFSKRAKFKNINVTYKKPRAKLPKVDIDNQKIRQVLQNLIDNSLKYTRSGGLITITLRKTHKSIEVKISDTGIGISEDENPNIFNRFYRGSNALKLDTQGTGLGLYIAKSIIEKHGGKIWFESIIHTGTIFYFTIPINQ